MQKLILYNRMRLCYDGYIYETVSYTNLDVYKRQPPLGELPSECEVERFREGETLWKFVLPRPLASALA